MHTAAAPSDADLNWPDLEQSMPLSPVDAAPGPRTTEAERDVGPSMTGALLAAAWAFVVLGSATAYAVAGSEMIRTAALVAAATTFAVGPAALILFASIATREARRARLEAQRIGKFTEEALTPEIAGALRAERISQSVRADLEAAQAIADLAAARLAEIEDASLRNARACEAVLSGVRARAMQVSQTLQLERSAIDAFADAASSQSERLSDAVTRQIATMQSITRQVEANLDAADNAFAERTERLSQAAAAVAERAAEVSLAADAAENVAARMHNVISHSLESLAQATSLTEAARQSADSAAAAALATATTIRDTSERALADVRKVSAMVRAETVAMEEAAAATLSRLREAADEARRASAEAQAAADAQTAALRRRTQRLTAAPQLQAIDESAAVPAAPANDRVAAEPPGLWSIAGVDPAATLQPKDLAYIVKSAREGGAARRQAVAAVAGQAVEQLRRTIERDASARAAATAMRSKSDVASAAAGGREGLIGYLLVDAALG